MARFTQARVARWQRDIAKAQMLLAAVRDDQRAAAQTTKGGRLVDVQRCLKSTREAIDASGPATQALLDLVEGEARRRPT